MQRNYEIGLVMGVFDLFHVGHLNLIRKARERCAFLRAGVLSDELVRKFKGHDPVINQDERMQILAALRYVDEVVLINDDPSRLIEFKRRPFDCFFCGDDYIDNPYFAYEKKELNKLGADICFLPYTRSQSSTMIRKKIEKI